MQNLDQAIPIFPSIEEYNARINISRPRYSDFDARDFRENMKTVHLKMSPFRIPFFQIALLESGGGEVSSDGQTYDLDNFTLFFTQPGQIIYWDVPQNWKGFYLSLEDSFYTVQLDEFKRLYDFPFFKHFTPAIRLKQEEAQLVLDIMQKMLHEYQHPSPYNKPIIKSYLSTILSYCVRFYDRELSDKLTIAEQSSLGERFKVLVNEHIRALALNVNREPISVASCAEQLFVSAKHLSETVKKEIGLTPTQYINQNLIQEAKRFLQATDLQVKEIAYQLGFQDVSYFNRVFKKLTQVSPAQFRKAS